MVVEKELRNTLFLSRYLCIKILVCDLIDTEHSISFFVFVKCFLGKKSKKIRKHHVNLRLFRSKNHTYFHCYVTNH